MRYRLVQALLLMVAVCVPRAWAQSAAIADDQCLKCHADGGLTSMRPEALAAMVRITPGQGPIYRAEDRIPALQVDGSHLRNSAHAGINCVGCHTGIERLPHNQRLPVTQCADCHQQVDDALKQGVHRPGTNADGKHYPECVDCHGDAHAIEPMATPRHHAKMVHMTEACMRCHNEVVNGQNPAESYRDHVHGQALFNKGLAQTATCMDCHGTHEIHALSDPANPMSPTQSPTTCGRCHEGIREIYAQSIHGQQLALGNKETASCTNCHRSHGINEVNADFKTGVVQECAHCHADLGRSYLISYHGKATALGGHEAAVCSSCHGAHDILPTTDTRSHVAPANLKKTCAQCHEDVNDNFVQYIAHVELTNRKANPEVFYTFVGMTALLCGVLLVFIPHGLLWLQRGFMERLHHVRGYHVAPRDERWVQRFRPLHRFTHFLIVVSFMGLVITGFPLKYSYTGWAHDIAGMLGGAHVMGLLHRGFALVTMAYAAIHLGFLVWFFTKHCPAPRLRYLFGPDSLIFSKKDLTDFIAMIRWFLWLGPRPRFDRWTYYEKFDYFGEIWGVFLIGSTGFILWFPMLFTRWLPGWVLNCAMVIHSIEALLAASVIFLVHFFNTHLRPEKFPIDMVMLTGSMTETEMKDERPAEYERLVASGKLESRIVPPVPFKWRLVGAIMGIAVFLLGIALIALALTTELSQLWK